MPAKIWIDGCWECPCHMRHNQYDKNKRLNVKFVCDFDNTIRTLYIVKSEDGFPKFEVPDWCPRRRKGKK